MEPGVEGSICAGCISEELVGFLKTRPMVEAVSNSPYWQEKSKSAGVGDGDDASEIPACSGKKDHTGAASDRSLATGGAICSYSLGLRQLSALSVSRRQDDL